MRIGIIDFGTNTLRLNIFETEDENFQIIYDEPVYSRIVENTVDGALSQDGIEHVIQTIEHHQVVCRHYRCERVECFSTASLRYISNAEDVISQVQFRSGVRIRMISGDEEASYDYRALKGIIDEKEGFGTDLGGGSFQSFTFDEKGPVLSASFPLGSSRVAKGYVAGDIPTPGETENIRKAVFEALSGAGFEKRTGVFHAMGGTAKAVQTLWQRTLGKEGNIPREDMETMLRVITEEPEESLELFDDLIPNRKRTITPGIIILGSIMEYMGLSEMAVHTVGVREGFLSEVLEEKPQTDQGIIDYILGHL